MEHPRCLDYLVSDGSYLDSHSSFSWDSRDWDHSIEHTLVLVGKLLAMVEGEQA